MWSQAERHNSGRQPPLQVQIQKPHAPCGVSYCKAARVWVRSVGLQPAKYWCKQNISVQKTTRTCCLLLLRKKGAAVQVVVYFGVGCIAEKLKAYERALSCVCVFVYISPPLECTSLCGE